jgi:hypothetical protein
LTPKFDTKIVTASEEILDTTDDIDFFSENIFGTEINAQILVFPTMTALLSSCISFIAINVAINFIPISILNSHWFFVEHEELKPTSPFILTIFNFPFDFITIFITFTLLSYFVRKKHSFYLMALVDIVVSAFLAIILYTLLLTIEGGQLFSNFSQYCNDAFGWFKDIIRYLTSSLFVNNIEVVNNLKDIHLLPILLSTFIPVFIYMAIFLSLSFCKPIIWITSRFFSIIGEKEKSVFKQFGILISIWMAAIKSIYDYITIH